MLCRTRPTAAPGPHALWGRPTSAKKHRGSSWFSSVSTCYIRIYLSLSSSPAFQSTPVTSWNYANPWWIKQGTHDQLRNNISLSLALPPPPHAVLSPLHLHELPVLLCSRICPMAGTSGGLLWTRQSTFGFQKMWGISSLAEKLLASRKGCALSS
jgi:hypothetical protein